MTLFSNWIRIVPIHGRLSDGLETILSDSTVLGRTFPCNYHLHSRRIGGELKVFGCVLFYR